MMNSPRAYSTRHDDIEDDQQHEHEHEQVRDIHALTPPPPSNHRSEANWETTLHHSHQLSSLSTANTEFGGVSTDNNFTTMSREFSALVLAGSSIDHNNTNSSLMSNFDGNNEGEGTSHINNNNNLGLRRIREDELMEETNPLAIVPDRNYPSGDNNVSSPTRAGRTTVSSASGTNNISGQSELNLQRVRKEEVEAKIAAWQNAKVAKINNRFKREDAVINGWENEHVQKATSWMKKIERKLEEKRAKAMEKMQNEVAKAHRKAEERRASAEAKRGTKVARVLEIANLMRAVGRAPTKRSFF